MTLPQDVVTLLATAGIDDVAYQEFIGDGLASAPATSPWRLLRQLAPESVTSTAPASAALSSATSASVDPAAVGRGSVSPGLVNPSLINPSAQETTLRPVMNDMPFQESSHSRSRDDAFVVPSLIPRASHHVDSSPSFLATSFPADGRSASPGAAGATSSGANNSNASNSNASSDAEGAEFSDTGEVGINGPSRVETPQPADRRQGGGLLRLSRNTRGSEVAGQEASLASVLQRVSS